MSKFIIACTGRCGSTYAQAILRICGLNVTHQKHITFNKQEPLPDEVDGEASFMAVPYLEDYKDHTIIHLWRDKAKVIDSWQRSGVFLPGWEKFYPEFYKAITKLHAGSFTPSEAIDAWLDEADKYADYHLNIETLTNEPHLLFQAIDRFDNFDKSLTDLIRTDANAH